MADIIIVAGIEAAVFLIVQRELRRLRRGCGCTDRGGSDGINCRRSAEKEGGGANSGGSGEKSCENCFRGRESGCRNCHWNGETGEEVCEK